MAIPDRASVNGDPPKYEFLLSESWNHAVILADETDNQ